MTEGGVPSLRDRGPQQDVVTGEEESVEGSPPVVLSIETYGLPEQVGMTVHDGVGYGTAEVDETVQHELPR
jgi:hypothetical protein